MRDNDSGTKDSKILEIVVLESGTQQKSGSEVLALSYHF